MTREERNDLIKLFQDHVTHVTGLQYGNYVLAETLCQRTKMLSAKYFPGRAYYFYDLVNLSFKSQPTDAATSRSVWDAAYSRLLAIAHTMLEELQLPDPGPRLDIKKIVITCIFFLIASTFLWTFNLWAKWQWLSVHPKQLSIYVSFQVVIALITALLLTKDRQGRFIEWLGIALSVLSLVVSTLN